ncbi:MAG: exodeoxyribonuclease III [Myxococcales bacterium]|nr:exodeoxyribonuclease III [Myxococcales bacterium]
MKIATWNVNSLRMRAARVTAWLATHAPDVLCLQETKVEDAKFPRSLLEDAGYHVEFHGQKSYNGVAIAAKAPMTDVRRGFGDGGDDAQARCIGATVAGWRVYSLYVPNGQEVGSDKYHYKLAWLARLVALAKIETQAAPRVALCGDFNIAPADNDVHDPAAWREAVLCSTPERQRLEELLACGFRDGFRALYPEARAFSWWDYRGASFFRDKGLRIDHVLCSAGAQALLAAVEIDRDERKGEGASDHAPVMATFRDA